MPASDEEGMSPDITGEADAGGGGGGGGGLPDGWLAVESQSRPGELVYGSSVFSYEWKFSATNIFRSNSPVRYCVRSRDKET